ncbi:MAG: LppX_LprAFG lipoprotein [Anaerolineae bacterium]|nr:LppX_LprAFG lipoprotein [Anaerolineae bacterium]NUQ03655.1 LppX_LprAFG lipoprotein [Anaerolineae bacterium]
MRVATILLIAAALLTACSGGAPTETAPDPLALVTEAAAKIRAVDTFQLSVIQEGPDYYLYTDYAAAVFRMATGQYVAPSVIQASVRVLALGLPVDVDVYAEGDDQWYRAIWTGNNWINQPFQAGFNAETLIAEETGFQKALESLIDLKYAGTTTLESGVNAHRLDATANGPDVAALLGGLIEPVGTVEVEAYIAVDSGYPVRFVIREFNSPYAATPTPGTQAEPVTWTIDLFDFNGAPNVDPPEGE